MKYVVSRRCRQNIVAFYRHVALKYKHTYSEWLMLKNIDDAIEGMLLIENGIPRRYPTIARWHGFHMAHTGHWYYAYTIDADTITIMDACHEQNMHD